MACPLRAWPCLHCLPESCRHDASTSALGRLLLPHDHHAGAGHPGRDTHTHWLWWMTFDGIDGLRVVSRKTDSTHADPVSPPCHPVCESGGPDDVCGWPVPSSDQTRPPQRAAAAVCLHRLLPGRTGHGHAGKSHSGWMDVCVYVIVYPIMIWNNVFSHPDAGWSVCVPDLWPFLLQWSQPAAPLHLPVSGHRLGLRYESSPFSFPFLLAYPLLSSPLILSFHPFLLSPLLPSLLTLPLISFPPLLFLFFPPLLYSLFISFNFLCFPTLLYPLLFSYPLLIPFLSFPFLLFTLNPVAPVENILPSHPIWIELNPVGAH